MTAGTRHAATTLVVLTLALPPGGPWLGSDKVKHFLMSAFVQSVSYSVARGGGLNRRDGNRAAGVASAVVGVWKEVRDKRAGKAFSVADLVWDAAGAGSMAALLNRTR